MAVEAKPWGLGVQCRDSLSIFQTQLEGLVHSPIARVKRRRKQSFRSRYVKAFNWGLMPALWSTLIKGPFAVFENGYQQGKQLLAHLGGPLSEGWLRDCIAGQPVF
jgi:hypothetical protein